MVGSKRVFILGAGFSKAAEMPLATELLPLICEKQHDEDMSGWLDGMREALAWLSRADDPHNPLPLSIEEVLHYARFDIEVFRLKQQLVPVGRHDGPGTPWTQAESIESWLDYLQGDLCEAILDSEDKADLSPIVRWAKAVTGADAVLTFNYDTLAERALTQEHKPWRHGFESEQQEGVPIYKLHGSIDWMVADRSDSYSKLDLLFEKANENRRQGRTGDEEDDLCLRRCRTPEQLRSWIHGRDPQVGWRTVGIAGLGTYKSLHTIPGLGYTWVHGMRALYHADVAVVVGFSMSDFDAMAQMQFAKVARARDAEGRSLRVTVIDPKADECTKARFERVFRNVTFVKASHEEFDWSDCA